MTPSSPSNAADLEARARSVLAAVFGVVPEAIGAEASPDTIAKWDSHGHLTLVVALEQEFGVQFTDTQIYEMLDFAAIVRTLQAA